MRHLGAFYQSIDLNAALTNINAVPDTQVYTSGTLLRVPPELPNLCKAAAIYLGTSFTNAQVSTPSLRALANYDISPLSLVAPFALDGEYDDRYDNPLALAGNEQLQFALNGDAAGAVAGYGLLEFSDGPVKAETRNSFTVKATGAAVLAAGQFVNTGVVFDTVLPAGNYDIIGLRAEGANLVAARVAFVGGTWRPGVLGRASAAVQDIWRDRQGHSGVFGSFNINQPPSIDCLGITDTTQVFYFDLVKTK
jgi:hypothetical protein